ncbi:MAG TPA: lysine-sensitive aspartokinase 3 [Longimicrobiaceae bacterium]|nr:lysine-sensitive aspartokinase 3 [Longimicrobiaceae bacterium]
MNAATILKFGGTSVNDAAAQERLAEIVRNQMPARPVVVVSAIRGVTDALLQATTIARGGEVGRAFDTLQGQVGRYAGLAAELLPPPMAEEVDSLVSSAALEIADLLRIISLHPGTFLPLQDEIVSYGERLSSVLVARVLRSRGIPAEAVDARRCILTDEEHTRATPLAGPTRERTRAELLPLVSRGVVPVLGGFIASAPSGATTTLGRGGSDYTGALVGAALDAREIQIWTDVTGFLTADPRVVPDARPLAHLSYSEAAELAYFGAKVLHPKTIQPAVERSIPVRVCNSHRPEEPGTVVDANEVVVPGVVKAIAHKPGVSIVHVASARMLGAYGFMNAIFDIFSRHRTAVDVVSTSEVSVSLSLDDTHALSRIVAELEQLGSVRVEGGFAIICLVGEGLRSSPGIAARVFGSLGDVDVAMISQGASNINLTFVVHEEAVRPVVQRLHECCFGPA